MTEIKKSLTILKARWPEVVFIIGFGFLVSVLNGISKIHRGSYSWVPFIAIGLLLVEVLIYLGFLRTVFLEGSKRQSPLVLLRAGKHFFWRICGLGLLYMILLGLLVQVIFWVIKIVTPIEGSLKEASPIIGRLCLSTAMLILIKPFLFLPPLIVVLDCRVLKSFQFLRRCKLSHAKELLVVYCIQMTIPFLGHFLLPSKEVATVLHTVSGLTFYVVWRFLTLMIFTVAVRFVASLDLVYDNRANSSDSDSLLKSNLID